ncbi:MAG: PAS domain S-box protein, partial [Syntrophales bacterium]|nr:PAS domain S-box protein [Syntrophales bacterium]
MRFRTKLALGFSAIMVLMAIALVIFFLGFYQKRIIEETENRRVSLVRYFSGDITNMALTGDTLQLKNTTRKFCEDVNYVDYVFVIGSDGQLLAHSFDHGFPSELFSANPLPKDKAITSKLLLTNKGRIRDFAIRPVKHMPAEIHVGMNEEIFYRQINDTAKMTIFIMLVCVALGLLLVYFMSRSFSKPLQNLNLAMDKFGKGDLDYRLEEKGDHEILNLIQGYNRMAGSIQEAAAKQQQVEERIKRLNSILKAIRNVNQMIVVEKDRDCLLQKACNILIEARGYDAAWLGFSGDGKTFATVKGSGFRLEDVSRFSEHVIGGDHPPCIRRIIAEKQKLAIVDKSRECGDCFFKDAHVGREAAIIRVEHTDRFYGLLAILFAPDVTADEEEKELLKEVAGDIGIALRGIEMEKALIESEQQLADIINFLPDATLAIDLDGKVVAWNRAIEEMTGVKAEDMLGKGNYEYALPFYGTRRPILIDLVLKPDSEIEEKYAFVRREGDALLAEAVVPFVKAPELFLWGKASPMYDHKGTVVGAIESIRDITDRKQAERKVRQSLLEKKVMLKEIHHRVKNNMQVISSLLNLQAGHIKDEQALELFKECQS